MSNQLEMNIGGENSSPDTRLSYSSATLLRGCEQKYFHYKVAKTDIDSDQSKDTKAFDIGKAFHYILEESKHEKPEKIGPYLEKIAKDYDLDENEVALVHAMVLKYLRLRSRQNLRFIAAEYAIEDEEVIGFIDLIEEDTETGLWYISDLKTAKTFYPTTLARLPMDRQLNLYASFYKQIAKKFKLKMKNFGGCRYKVTTKSSAKMRKSESYADFVMRLVDSYIKTYDVIIPKDKLHINEVVEEFNQNYKRSLELRNGEAPSKNFGYCESYFKPCEYWSQCHGSLFSEIKESLEVEKEE
jgi:hypothetical protein